MSDGEHAVGDGDALAVLTDRLAPLLGIETSYRDVMGTVHHAGVESMLAIINAMGHPLDSIADAEGLARRLEAERAADPVGPLVLSWVGEHLVFDVRLPAVAPEARVRAHVLLEDGRDVPAGFADLGAFPVRLERVHDLDTFVYRVDLGQHVLAPGYHSIVLDLPHVGLIERPFIHAPRRVVELRPDERLWGVFAPLYALRSAPPAASATPQRPLVTDLDRLGAWVDSHGARIIGTLPILAAYLDQPFEPSPYSPVSRQFWNEIYLDHRMIPELSDAAVASVRAAAPPRPRNGNGSGNGNGGRERFDHREAHEHARRTFHELLGPLDSGRWPDALVDALESWAQDNPDAVQYARFRAHTEEHGKDWRSWPEDQQQGHLGSDTSNSYWYHLFGQFEMGRQLRSLFDSLERRGQRLYLDLPVGSHSAGFDTWKHRDLFAEQVACGAPPDEFFTEGQSWGFPPMVPATSSATAHAFFRTMVAHHMAVAGILRLDHVMGLHRMYWVPDGMSAADGVYVRYPREELMAVLAIESHRHDCVVVGEDLGTVPDEVRESMDDHGLLGMYVAEFNVPSWRGGSPEVPTRPNLASIDTHDTPTFAGWRAGSDLRRRAEIGQLDDDGWARLAEERRTQVANLGDLLQMLGLLELPEGDVTAVSDVDLHEATVRLLADSDASALLVTLEDLWGEPEPQNIPDTGIERPNWVQQLPRTIDELADDPSLASTFEAIQAARLGAHVRARHGSST